MTNKNINFRKTKNRKKELKTRLQHRFDERLLSAEKYCKRYGFTTDMFSKLMDGRVTGEKSKPDGKTARIISRLKADGIWLGKLPWEKKGEK